MAVPKRRHSSTRGRKRRTHWKLRAPGLSMNPDDLNFLRLPDGGPEVGPNKVRVGAN